MHSNTKAWFEKKKKELARKQEEYSERTQLSTKKLKRTRVTGKGKVVTDYDVWPADKYDDWHMAERSMLQRIANHMERPINPGKLHMKLSNGEKITNKYGDVYSLVPLTGH